MMRKRLILRGATAEPPGGHPAPVPCRAHPLHHGLPEGPELAPGHATGHRNSVEGARVTQAGPAGPSENLAETYETAQEEQSLAREGKQHGKDVLGGGEKAALASSPEARRRHRQTEVGLSPAAGRPCPVAPGRTSQESEAPVYPLHVSIAGLCLLGCCSCRLRSALCEQSTLTH